MSNYNRLNSVKIDLAKCGICQECGRRFTDPLCTHATPEQIAYTLKLDAEVYAEYDKKHPVNEAQEIEREIDEKLRTDSEQLVDVTKHFNGYKATASKTWAELHLNGG